jgi:hypothetical protein
MNAIVENTIKNIQRLPDVEQEAMARDVLDRIAADAKWRELLGDPRSEGLLRKLADEARRDIRGGDVTVSNLPALNRRDDLVAVRTTQSGGLAPWRSSI